MPRPRMDAAGNVVPEKDLRKLWIVVYDNSDDTLPLNLLGNTGYLTRQGEWADQEFRAAAWYDHEKDKAEEVVARIVLADPGKYFGKIRVKQVLG